jgi:hypothetical protein
MGLSDAHVGTALRAIHINKMMLLAVAFEMVVLSDFEQFALFEPRVHNGFKRGFGSLCDKGLA